MGSKLDFDEISIFLMKLLGPTEKSLNPMMGLFFNPSIGKFDVFEIWELKNQYFIYLSLIHI